MWVPHVLPDCDVPPSPHRLKPSRKQRKRHMFSSLIKWKKIPEILMQVPTTQKARKTVEVH